MASSETQIWKSARLTIERGESETHGTVFRLSGPFTGRDMYNSLSPDGVSQYLRIDTGRCAGACTRVRPDRGFRIWILRGWECWSAILFGCQSKGIRLSITGVNARVQELFRLTGMTTVLPIV